LKTGKTHAVQESLAQQFLDSSQEFLKFARGDTRLNGAFPAGPAAHAQTVGRHIIQAAARNMPSLFILYKPTALLYDACI